MTLSIDMKKTGTNIKRCIRESGYTIREIMEITGITVEQTIYKWYRGESLPSLENQLILCTLFGIPLTSLLVLSENIPVCYETDRMDQPDRIRSGMGGSDRSRFPGGRVQCPESQLQRLSAYFRISAQTA